MHCMDSDYSVFSILPPYNTIEAQVIVSGKLVTNGSGYTVTYQAIADPDGSINKTSAGKGNWLRYAPQLYGAVAADQGLPFPGPDSFWMPGKTNVPQRMLFDAGPDWFYAYGIPITPYDDAGKKNPYPLMRLIAHNAAGTALATNDIVLPVSDEMDCRACHASGGSTRAKPADGWVWSSNPERDFRLNILRLHDQMQFSNHFGVYVSALSARGYNSRGLYRSVVANGKPVLCAACHASEALGTGSYSNIPPLTASIHTRHARTRDPLTSLSLDSSANRSACYRCHPGSATRCLRGAMGGAIADDGSLEMQCQSCHGNMTQVGRATRTGWLNEPTCQQCHTGTATSNNGQIRYTSCFTDTNYTERVAVNQTFATKSNTPAAGLSLYRFSAGHGGLQCSACHGSTHAEFPATHRNDNLRNEKIQGHAGVMVECTACHTSMSVNSTTARGGPHGMHPVGSSWVSGHHDYIGSLANCQACHGVDYRGTELSRMQTTRSLSVSIDGTPVNFPTFKGAEVGCYNCHNGPFQSSANVSANPVANDVTTNALNSQPLVFALPVSGAGVVARVIGQPAHGTVGVSNNVATYFPEAGFVGTDTFTFAGWNGAKNSRLATGSVSVAQGPSSLAAAARVPATWPVGWPAPFNAVVTATNTAEAVTYEWSFGDGKLASTNQQASHTFVASGVYTWSVTTRAGSAEARATGAITITGAAVLTASLTGGEILLAGPVTAANAVLEETPAMGPAAWEPSADAVPAGPASFRVPVPSGRQMFYRLRLVE